MTGDIYQEFVDRLFENNIFQKMDLLFAKAILNTKSLSKEHLALSYLMAVSRRGHLCVKIQPGKIVPNIFHAKADSFSEIFNFIIDGFKNLSSYIVANDQNLCSKKPIYCIEDEKDIRAYYLNKNFIYETKIINHLLKFLTSNTSCDQIDLKEMDRYLLQKEDLFINQKHAVKKMLTRPISFIFGGPGTGKTYTAAAALSVLDRITQKKIHVIFAAPTGKAAINLMQKVNSEYQNIQVKACTIHSLLKLFSSHQNKYFTSDYIFVDEASMLDAKMMSLLFQLIRLNKNKLVLLGDPAQLPPIESGNLFSIFSKLPFNTSIETLRKQVRCEEKKLQDLFEIVRSGKEKEFFAFVEKNKLMTIFDEYETNSIVEKLIKQVDNNFGLHSYNLFLGEKHLKSFEEFRILASNKTGLLGTDNLNREIYDYMYFKALSNRSISHFIYPIMICRNDYSLGLFNGYTGVICQDLKSGNKKAYFILENKVVYLNEKMLPPYEISYAMSIHKSQGSEFNAIALILSKGSEVFGKELLYTGLTRAKKTIEIISEKRAITTILKNQSIISTNLIERIEKKIKAAKC